MEEPHGFRKFLISLVKFFRGLEDRIRKTDKRFLIMVIVAIVIVIILLSLIVHGVKSSNKAKEPQTSDASVNVVQTTEPVTEPDSAVSLNGVGRYVVATGSDNDLNMRLAANSNSDILTQIPNGTELRVLFVDDSGVTSDNKYGWGYVEYSGKRGWVFMEYLTSK